MDTQNNAGSSFNAAVTSGLNALTDSLLFTCQPHFGTLASRLPFLPILRLPRRSRLFSPSLSLSSFHVFSFFSSQSHPASLPLCHLDSCLPSPQLHFALRAAGAGSTVAAPVAFTSLAAPSRLLSCFLFISLFVCPSP